MAPKHPLRRSERIRMKNALINPIVDNINSSRGSRGSTSTTLTTIIRRKTPPQSNKGSKTQRSRTLKTIKSKCKSKEEIKRKKLLKQLHWDSDSSSVPDTKTSINRSISRASNAAERTTKAEENARRRDLLKQLGWGSDTSSSPKISTNEYPHERGVSNNINAFLDVEDEVSSLSNERPLGGDNSETESLLGEGVGNELKEKSSDGSDTYVRDDVDMEFVVTDDEASSEAWSDPYEDSTNDGDLSAVSQSGFEAYRQGRDKRSGQSRESSKKIRESDMAGYGDEHDHDSPSQELVYIRSATPTANSNDSTMSKNSDTDNESGLEESFYQVVSSTDQHSQEQAEEIIEAIRHSTSLRAVGRRPLVTNTFVVPIQIQGQSIGLSALRQARDQGIAQLVWRSDIAEAYEIGIRQACPVGFGDDGTTKNAHWWVGLPQAHIKLGPFATEQEIKTREKQITKRNNQKKRKVRKDNSDDEDDEDYVPGKRSRR
ncbi:hypothetical protein AOQ84DRAFT_375050 [Glonium stellatum]|uniref:Uncharacterized protein n=1 Tax=Glonium stellatum TaxID=574774 RepID=A0A8E2F488_9PEZI|nr:hypothetical protein AOQ84DRAFT_375050 [Glonium stellatum]